MPGLWTRKPPRWRCARTHAMLAMREPSATHKLLLMKTVVKA
jgi:hypothetical protein